MKTTTTPNQNLLKDSLLFSATSVWEKLSHYQHKFVYGFRKQLYTILLTFSPEEFYHLAGFQYLRDLAIPRYNAKKLIKKILNGEISQEQIEQGAQYKKFVAPRLDALLSLEKILNNTFTLYSFRSDLYPFHTSIQADYLISSEVNGLSFVFLFGGKPKALVRECICRSIFVMIDRNYEDNQRPYTILKKTRIDLSTQSETVLYIKDGFEEPLQSEDN